MMGKEITDRILLDPEVLGGKPVIKGTRIPIYLILALLGNGLTEKEVIREYPALKDEDIKAALLYAAKLLENKKIILLLKKKKELHD